MSVAPFILTDDVFHGGEPLPNCVRISAHAPPACGLYRSIPLYAFIPNVADVPPPSPRDRDAPAGERPPALPISPAGKFLRES